MRQVAKSQAKLQEAAAADPERRPVLEAFSHANVLRTVVEGAAAKNAQMIFFVRIFILHPFPYVAAHIVQTKAIPCLCSDRLL